MNNFNVILVSERNIEIVLIEASVSLAVFKQTYLQDDLIG